MIVYAFIECHLDLTGISKERASNGATRINDYKPDFRVKNGRHNIFGWKD